MLWHLERTSNGMAEALDLDLAKREDLAVLQPYLPSLSVWSRHLLFTDSISIDID